MWIKSTEIKNLTNLLILNGPMIFMSLTALMGMRFDREEGAGGVYKAYMVMLFIFGVLPILKKVITGHFSSKFVLPLFVISVFIAVGLIQQLDSSFLLQMGCFAVPAICVALTMDQKTGLIGMMKWFELLLPLFAISFIFLIRNMMFVKLEGEVNSYDQSASYYAAFLFIIDIYILRYKNYCQSFAFLDHKWFLFFKIFMLPYLLVVCFFAGGRGAVVLIIISLIFQANLLKKLPVHYYGKGCLIVIVLSIVVYFGIGKLSIDYFDLLEHNYERISALVEGGHIDTSASSGRDNIWKDAIDTWASSPLIGYGLFSYLDFFYIRPHNIFLEVMLQGGLVLLSILCYILLRTFIKYRKLLRTDHNQVFLMPFLLFTFVELSLSGSYWFEPFFWFVLVYIYNYSFKKQVNVIKPNN